MTNRKTKRKIIDGVVKKGKKTTKKPSTVSKKTATVKEAIVGNNTTATPNNINDITNLGETKEAPVHIETKDTTVTIIEADDMDESSAAVLNDTVDERYNTTIDEPDVENDDIVDDNLDALINDIENDATETEADLEIMDQDTEKAEARAAKNAANAIANQEETMSSTRHSRKTNKLHQKPTAKPFRIISRLLVLGTIITTVAFTIRIAITNILPNKFLIPIIAVLAFVLFLYTFKAFRNKTHIPVLIIFNLIGIVLVAASIFGFIKIDETMAFLNQNFGEAKEYSIYNIIVNKKSNYNSIDDVNGKTFHSISDFVDTEKLETAAKEQANASIVYTDGITSLLKGALDSNDYIAVINSGTYSSAVDGDNESSKNYTDNLKIIGELKVETQKKDDTSTSSLTNESFTIYISGIDTRSGLMLDRSLSDVNIVVAVNPKTKNILMSTIPRDYYVQLHGTSGLPDKLTHAGSLGGVQLSMDTISDLLDIDFDRYIRVNFNFVVNLVDAIGGITVYSDVDYDFTTHTAERCVFHPGNNFVDGKCALAFARERSSYADGDRHRGRNQEQVIEKVFEKVTSSSTLISHYSDILNALSGSFDSNISPSDITSFVNMQLSDMAKWAVNSYNLDGTGGMAYTYSYPSQLLYVMYPDQTTVDTAKQKIQETLTGEL